MGKCEAPRHLDLHHLKSHPLPQGNETAELRGWNSRIETESLGALSTLDISLL
jgi:hypothetical protein